MMTVLETQRHLEEAKAMEDARRAQKEQKPEAMEAARIREAAVARPAGGPSLTPHARPSGQLAVPVKGELVKSWGDPEDGGPATGQSWKTDPGATVVAPCGGTVAFAAPFRHYGPLVIIECGGGFHVVLSGMKHLGVAPGQTIRDTDPIGEMPAPDAGATSDTPAARTAASPVLYFEFRKGGKPVNPAPWLRAAG
jgi:septal ring factor EnvC (AmiA/AmiB activator)